MTLERNQRRSPIVALDQRISKPQANGKADSTLFYGTHWFWDAAYSVNNLDHKIALVEGVALKDTQHAARIKREIIHLREQALF